MASALLAPGQSFAQASTPKSGGTLRIAMPFNPAALDPMTGRNVPDFNALYALFDALIAFDPATLELKPMLAKDWTFTDPTTLVLNLIDGVKFHDGTPFNAEAVKFNFDRFINDPEVQREVRPRFRRLGRRHRPEPGDDQAEAAELFAADHPHRPRRLHRLAPPRSRPPPTAMSTASRSAPARSSSSNGATTT